MNEDIFFKIEEIFAKEDYRRNFVSLYRKYLGRDDEISADLGFEYCSIKNDITTNKDIISIINNNFKTNLNKSLFEDYKIENHMKAFIEIFKVIYDDKLNDESINELEKYISEIESKLGNYIKISSIEEEGNHINMGYTVNPFYINFRTWLSSLSKWNINNIIWFR